MTLKLGLAVVLSLFAIAAQSQSTDITGSSTSAPDSIVQLTADAQGLSQIPADQLPQYGTFWVITPNGFPQPWPVRPPATNLPVYGITGNAFLVDATDGQVFTRGQPTTAVVTSALATMATNVVNVINQVQGAQMEQDFAAAMGMDVASFDSAMTDASSAATPDGSFSPMAAVDYGTNLWIAQTCITNGYLAGIGSNTIADVKYEIQSRTNLLQADWQSEGFIWGSELTNWTALSVPQIGRTNLFIRLKSWADDGSGLPIWWQMQFFGYVGVDPNGNPSGDGWSNIQKFQNGMDPNLFYTPPTPQGIVAALHQSSHTSTINWVLSPGAVTGYTLEKTDSSTTPATVQTFSLAASVTTYSDSLSGNNPDPYYPYGNNYAVSYRLKANYTGGHASPWTAPLPLQQPTVSASMTPGANGSASLEVSGVPATAASVRLVFIDMNAVYNGDLSFDYTEDVPVSSITNGVYSVPSSWQPPATDAYGEADYWVYAETVDDEGNESGATFFDGRDVNWPAPYNWGVPFYDGRVQMKQNLIFQLRAATVDNAFHFAIQGTSSSFGANPGDYLFSTNYAYAGLYEYANFSGYNAFYTIGTLDAFLPFEENYLFRNFVFSPANADNHGSLTTGVVSGGFPDYITLTSPTFQFQINLTNSPALLASNATRWLLYDQSSYGDDVVGAGLINVTNAGSSGDTITMNSGFANWFGLPYVTANIAGQSYPNGSLVTNLLRPGYSSTSLNYEMPYSIYPETVQPKFRTVEYDFWNPLAVNPVTGAVAYPLPGDPLFSVTNQNQLLITTVGNMLFQIAGYAKLEVTNSAYTGVYGYLGQYFDKAYQVDANGNVTTNTTGVLSPYGGFFASEPGQAALTTMPDPDTGARGTCMVYSANVVLDRSQGGKMDLSYHGAHR